MRDPAAAGTTGSIVPRPLGRPSTPPTLLELAIGFAQLGLRGFGGVGGIARHVLVVERGWIDEGVFAETLGLGQALPGPNVGNLAAIIGDRKRGPLGAVVAVAALTVPSMVVAILLASAVGAAAMHAPRVIAVERTVGAAAGGLVIATGLRAARIIARTERRRRRRAARLAIVAAIGALIAGAHVSLLIVVPAALLLSMVLETLPATAPPAAATTAAGSIPASRRSESSEPPERAPRE